MSKTTSKLFDGIFTCQDSLKREVQCRLILYRCTNGNHIGIACELPPPYIGPSVTNAAAYIWKAVRRRFLHRATIILFSFECYPMHQRMGDIEIDKVLLGYAHADVVWMPSNRAEVEQLIGERLPL